LLVKMVFNRKGNVVHAVFLLGVFGLIITALLIFVSFENGIKEKSGDFFNLAENAKLNREVIEKRAEIIGRETISSGASDLKKEFKRIAEERNPEYEGSGNFFKKIRDGEFTFKKVDGGYLLEVNELFFVSKIEGNEIRSNFNLRLEFESDGRLKDETFINKK
jgi:hypothetical protein